MQLVSIDRVVVSQSAVATGANGHLRKSVVDFSSEAPFAFRANRPGLPVWTPDRLGSELGIKDFGRMEMVHVAVYGANDEDVIDLVNWWTVYDYPVTIKFPGQLQKPVVGTPDSPFCFGVTAAAAFEFIEGAWRATQELITKIASFFSDNRMVTVAV